MSDDPLFARLASAMVAAILILATVSAPAAAPASRSELDQRLNDLDRGFQEAVDREVEKPWTEALRVLDTGYAAAVDRALATAMHEGKTDDALALREEKQRLEKGGDIPAGEDGAPDMLKGLRTTYRTTRWHHTYTRAMNLQPLFYKYQQALAALEKELTKAGQLDEALRVKAVCAEVAKASVTGNIGAVITASGGRTRITDHIRSFTNSLGMKFVPVPGIKVLFCIHETRKKDYATYATANPDVNAAWKNPQRDDTLVSATDDEPVVNVSWDSSAAFCAWLSKREGHTYRLPTDREWSFAAGIGSQESPTASPRELSTKIKGYVWGTQWPPPEGSGNFQDESVRGKFKAKVVLNGYNDGYVTTAPVMTFKPNDLGLYDLAGNVGEWCEDWFDDTKLFRVVRGSGWTTVNPLVSFRGSALPTQRIWDTGFRCVVEMDQ